MSKKNFSTYNETRQLYSAAVPANQSDADFEQFRRVQSCFENSSGSFAEKMDAFSKFCSRRAMAKFLSRYETFKRILNVNGSILEFGVLHGAGLFTFAKLSSILEPTNHTRRIIGFDTFQGFASVHEKDKTKEHDIMKDGSVRGSGFEEISEAIDLFDSNRPLNHIPKVELVKGDICKTAPEFLERNPHLVVSMIYLDTDLYEPTKVALKTFLPRMPKGGIIVFDELNAQPLPGETLAVDEILGIRNLRIERFPFDSYYSFAIVE